MIADPYKVLGVGPNATDAELKKAYREMSKKYHPDANPNDPKAAEEKFKEVQEAYRQIQTAKEQGTSAYGTSSSSGYQQNPYQRSYSSNSYQQNNGQYRRNGYTDYDETRSTGYAGFDEFFGFGGWNRYSEQQRTYQAQNETNEMRAARNYINSGYYNEAINALSGMPVSSRNAQWYYLHAVASSGIGNNIAAMESARKACDMEPSNAEYARLLQRLQSGGSAYQERSSSYNRNAMMTMGLCLGCCAVNMACTLCGRGGVFFC